MKLNYECVRAVLLYLEENITRDHKGYVSGWMCADALAAKFSNDDVFYSIEKLHEEGYIILTADRVSQGSSHRYIPGEKADICDIHISGHKFLDTIRSPIVWQKTMEKLQPIGGATFQMIMSVASSILAEILKNNLIP